MSNPVEHEDPSASVRRAIIFPTVVMQDGETSATVCAILLEQDLKNRFPDARTRRAAFYDGDGGGEVEVFSDAVHQGVAPVTIFRWPKD